MSLEISVRPDCYDLGRATAFDGRAIFLDCHAIFLTGQLRRIFPVRHVITLESWVYHLVDTQFVRLSVLDFELGIMLSKLPKIWLFIGLLSHKILDIYVLPV